MRRTRDLSSPAKKTFSSPMSGSSNDQAAVTCRTATFACMIATALLTIPSTANALGTSYEGKIKGFIHAILKTFISGEFAGRRSPNVVAMRVLPTCKPSDYERLLSERNDPAALDRFYLSCTVVEFDVDDTHIRAVSYLPSGYCDVLKSAFEAFLKEILYSSHHRDDLIRYEYKGAHYAGSRGSLARRAQLTASCHGDGSLQISAVRKRRQ